MAINLKTSAVEFSQSLECPVQLEPLDSAVSLVPCMHKLNEVVARELFGGMQGDQCEIENVECPACTRVVKAYYPDRVVRTLAKSARVIFGISLNPLNLPQSKAREADQKHVKEIRFPGLEGEFKLMAFSNPLSRRSVQFKNVSQGALFKELVVRGHQEDDGFDMTVTFKRYREKQVIEYLEAHRLGGYEVMVIKEMSAIKVSHGPSLKIFFPIITKYNKIPSPWLSNISKWVEAGKWPN